MKKKNGEIIDCEFNTKVKEDDKDNKIFFGFIRDVTERIRKEDALKKSINEKEKNERILTKLLESANAVLLYENFEKTARIIFDFCKDLIGAKTGYVVLLSHGGSENEVLFFDAGGFPCTVESKTPYAN